MVCGQLVLDIALLDRSHAHLTYLKGDNITIMNQELDLLDSALHRILGFKPKLFSPPYGERPSDEALEVIVEDQDMKREFYDLSRTL